MRIQRAVITLAVLAGLILPSSIAVANVGFDVPRLKGAVVDNGGFLGPAGAGQGRARKGREAVC